MQTQTKVVLGLGVIVAALALGGFVRYSVLQGRSSTELTTVSTFKECVEAQYELDITGSVCTTPDGIQYLKAGVADASTTVPSTIAATTTTGTSSTPTEPITISLDTPAVFKVGDAQILPNGTTLTLTQIDDSRCKPGVQCIWAGEFTTTWTVTQNTLTKTFTLGTVRTISTTTANYTYTLDTAEDRTATIHVSAPTTATVGTTGTVTGTVTVSPLCPVESIDHPCVTPPETYTSRAVVVYAADGTTELEQHPLSETGEFRLSLTAGSYALQIRPAGIGAGEIKRVTVAAGQTALVDFAIDSGIR